LQPAMNLTKTMPEGTVLRYAINPGMSRFDVQVFATGLLSSFGHDPVISIRGFSGEAKFDANSFEASSLHVVIDAGTLTVDDGINDKDREEIRRLMNQNVLEVSDYPEIEYESLSVTGSAIDNDRFRLALSGNLTLHGITRPQRIAAYVVLDGGTMRASGNFSVRQSEYQIKPVSTMGGALKVKDELKFSFDMVAQRTD